MTYLTAVFNPWVLTHAFNVACFLTALTIFLMGAAKSRVTEENWFMSGMEMLLIGGAAAGVSYLVGYILKEFHFEESV